LRVGDIVRVKDKEEIPADLILFESSEKGGKAYIQTMSLDGEINLKPK
jgi:P-type E1-E2 ATPase